MARAKGSKDRSAMSRKFAIATAGAKKAGYSDFSKGSAGYTKRREIAEAIAREGIPGPRKHKAKFMMNMSDIGM